MTMIGEQMPTRGSIPDLYRAIIACGSKTDPLRGPLDIVDTAMMTTIDIERPGEEYQPAEACTSHARDGRQSCHTPENYTTCNIRGASWLRPLWSDWRNWSCPLRRLRRWHYSRRGDYACRGGRGGCGG